MTLKTSNIELRPYQNEAISVMRECAGHSLFAIPMSGGKTEIFLKFAESHPNKNTLCVFNTVKLVKQTHQRAIENGISSSIFCASLNKKDISQLTMASVQSIQHEDLSNFDYIIFDECHRAFGDSKAYKEILNKFSGSFFGFTATPYNQKGQIFGNGKLFEKINFYVTFNQLLEEGFIVPIVGKDSELINRNELIISKTSGDFTEESLEKSLIPEKLDIIVKKTLKSLSPNHKKIAWWCGSINHADMISNKLNELGEKSISYHSKTVDKDILERDFENGDVRHVSFVNIISEGYSYSPLSALVCIRPTTLHHLWVQTCGRVNRIFNGKKEGVVLDYAGNFKSLGHPYNISPWDIPSLLSGEKKPSSCSCKTCNFTAQNYFDVCPKCQATREKTVDRDEQRLKKIRTNYDSEIYAANETTEEYPEYVRIDDYISKNGTAMKKVTLNNRTIFFYTDAHWGRNDFYLFKKGFQYCKDNPGTKINLKMNKKGFWKYDGIKEVRNDKN